MVNGSSDSSPSASESESASEEESEYSSDSDDEAESEEPSPLPAARPTDARKAIEYDVIKCVWSRRTTRITAGAIRAALGEYWEIIKRIRDNWKVEVSALQQVDEAKDKARADHYKSRAAEQRRIIEGAFRLTMQHGHRDIVEKYVYSPVSIAQSACKIGMYDLETGSGYVILEPRNFGVESFVPISACRYSFIDTFTRCGRLYKVSINLGPCGPRYGVDIF